MRGNRLEKVDKFFARRKFICTQLFLLVVAEICICITKWGPPSAPDGFFIVHFYVAQINIILLLRRLRV